MKIRFYFGVLAPLEESKPHEGRPHLIPFDELSEDEKRSFLADGDTEEQDVQACAE